jgi:molybdopterin converting factor small subunit
MKIRACYMAQLRQAAGRAVEEVEVDAGCSVRDFVVHLAQARGQPLRNLLLGAGGEVQPTILIFVGDEQVPPGQVVPLRDGDVVTLLSPIAGGS